MEVASIQKQNKPQEIAYWGLRAAIGVIFIVHGYGKMDPGFAGFLQSLNLPTELQMPIALAELIAGALLIAGVLTRISASVISVLMLGAIFYVKQPTALTGQSGAELELILLAGSLLVVAAGPGGVSVSRFVKKLPSFLK